MHKKEHELGVDYHYVFFFVRMLYICKTQLLLQHLDKVSLPNSSYEIPTTWQNHFDRKIDLWGYGITRYLTNCPVVSNGSKELWVRKLDKLKWGKDGKGRSLLFRKTFGGEWVWVG